jgi:DUF1365 family protein
LGYAFNPVSFYYLYSADKTLKAMLLEVNNTFDEKRLYFMEAGSSKRNNDPSSPVDSGLGDSDTDNSDTSPEAIPKLRKTPAADLSKETARIFANEWPKDLHVSPFNTVDGSYSVQALDPFEKSDNTRPIDIRITLIQNDRTKLLARVFSSGDSFDPLAASAWARARFVMTWWWVGLVIMPRTVWQAWCLFRKEVPHYDRPEPLQTSLCRRESDSER